MKEKLVILKDPLFNQVTPINSSEFGSEVKTNVVNIPNANFPKTALFEVANPFMAQNNLSLNKIVEQLDDDDFDVKVVSFEEKTKVISNLTTKASRVREGAGNVISFFKEAADYKLKHMEDFRTLADQAAVMARLSAAACAPGDGHGTIQTNSSISSAGELSLSSNVSSIFSKGGHKEGQHDHCNNCGSDLNDGKCSKCAA